jgi:hypothetical protein
MAIFGHILRTWRGQVQILYRQAPKRLITTTQNKSVEIKRTRLTAVPTKFKACLIYRKTQVQVRGNRGRRYLKECESGKMHQSDVPECAPGALAADCVKLDTRRGSRSQTTVIFILDMEVLLQDCQGKFYEATRVSGDVITTETARSSGTHGDEWSGKAKGMIREIDEIQADKVPGQS